MKSLANTIEEMGNPFTENSNDLLVLGSKDLADPAVINTVRQIEKLGQEKYDAYVSERLVSQTTSISDPIKREKRGKGVRRRVEPSSAVLGNWQEFLRIDENKEELLSFLATSVISIDSNMRVISTHHTNVFCNQPRDNSRLAPCTHEEDDS